jgi:RNA polymerase sigma-70 factor (ECF subfamily)
MSTPALSELRERLARAAAQLLPSWTTADRDDVVQQAMLRVVRHLDRHDGEAPTQAWLRRAAHSAMIDEIRSRRGARVVPTEHPPEQIDPAPSPEGGAEAAQLGLAIRDCVEHAVHESRRAAVHLWLLGHSVPEGSQLLGIGAKQCENFVYRGLAELRDCLRHKGYAP